MSVLEATVEIVKISSNNEDSFSSIVDEFNRKNLLKGIEEIYNKLKVLEQNSQS